MVFSLKAFKRLLLSKVVLEVQALEFHVTINEDGIATSTKHTNKQTNKTLGLFFLHLAHFQFAKVCLYMNTFQNIQKIFAPVQEQKKKQKNVNCNYHDWTKLF